MARRTCIVLLALSGTLAGGLCLSPEAEAQGVLIGRPLPGPRPVPVPPPQPLTIKSQRVSLTVDSGAVRAQVSETFQNQTSAQMEGTYLFKLPEGAAVSNFRMQIGNEPVDGKILNVEEARRIYESFVRRQVDPGILEYVGRNAFQARIFPIAGNSEKEIQIGYSHAAGFQNGLYQVTYPLNTEKASPAPLKELAIQCTLKSNQPIKAIYSPTHEIQVKRENDRLATITFEAKEIRANRDFVVYYSVSEKEFGLNALTHRKGGEDGYLMMMLAPKRETSGVEVLPKDVVFVFDTSGSMQGAKIEQARRALQTVLGALGARDRFNVVRFSTDVTQFRDALVDASAANVKAAREFVNEFKAVGGTAINDALEAALSTLPPPNTKRSTFVIFMTDGLPTIGETSPEKILETGAKARRPDVRLFTFGVGNDVNALLLDRLALNGSGAADYVGPDEDLETKVAGFYAKIANPVLSNVKVSLDGGQLVETYPNRVPDLFAGAQLLVLGRFKGGGKGTVKVTGDVAGAPRSYSYDIALPAEQKDYGFIPKLWASRKIGYLLEEIRLRGETDEVKNEVIRLSKEYAIVTPYTAFLVEEPNATADTPLVLRRALEREALGGPLGGGGFGGARGAGVPGGAMPARPGGPTQLGASDLGRTLDKARQAANSEAFFRQTTGRDAIQQRQRLRELKENQIQFDEVLCLQEVEGRKFQWQRENWEEQAVDPKTPVLIVKFGSDAYFQLLNHNRQWAKFLALGKNVTFRTGKTRVVRINEKEGKEKLTAAELKALGD